MPAAITNYFPMLPSNSNSKDCNNVVQLTVFDGTIPVSMAVLIYRDVIILWNNGACIPLTPFDCFCTLQLVLEYLASHFGIDCQCIDITTDILSNHGINLVLNLPLWRFRTECMNIYTSKYILNCIEQGLPHPMSTRDMQTVTDDLEEDHIAVKVAEITLQD